MTECRKAFCAGMLTSRALIFTSSTSRSSISWRSSGSMTHPRLLKLCRCEPAIATKTLRIMTSLFCSASTTASCTHFIAVSKSTISPLRTPRDGVWPTPRILIVPSGRLSPTTTQILDVPISSPTVKLLLAIVISPFSAVGSELLWRRAAVCFRPRRCGFCLRMYRDCFQNPRFDRWLDRVVDDGGGRSGEGHGDISLHQQVHRLQFLL